MYCEPRVFDSVLALRLEAKTTSARVCVCQMTNCEIVRHAPLTNGACRMSLRPLTEQLLTCVGSLSTFDIHPSLQQGLNKTAKILLSSVSYTTRTNLNGAKLACIELNPLASPPSHPSGQDLRLDQTPCQSRPPLSLLRCRPYQSHCHPYPPSLHQR